MESIQSLVLEVKKEIFLPNDYDNVSPSAYDTAWLAMIPYGDQKNGTNHGPMFNKCLNWIVKNQKKGGFWGETIIEDDDLPTIDALPATLACLLALKTWNASQHQNIEKGLEFIHSKVEIILKSNYQDLPRWFILAFPAMIELVEAAGLDIVFPPGSTNMIATIFNKRQQILESEEVVDGSCYLPPLLSYLETLPSTYHFDRQKIVKHNLSCDGSLFQSPSATVQAFMTTGNADCLKYLKCLQQKFPNGVPAKYPMDRDLIKLCMVDHIQGLGLTEHFNEDIEQILAQVYRNQKENNKSKPRGTNIFQKLFKDASSFRLLRMQGHCINPESFCWFLDEPEILAYMEANSEELISTMYSVYRATDIQFPGESEMDEARKIAIKILENPVATTNRDNHFFISKEIKNMIRYELNVPWIARLDHLSHREWIETNKVSALLWIGKASFYRLSCLNHKKLMQLAVENFEFRQSIYRQELEDLKGWSKRWKLSEMGFGREKTVYCYYTAAASLCLLLNSVMRLVIAKSAIIVTVADDFYDMEGSLIELEALTNAVKRWDSRELQGHSKTIFDALDDFVNETASKFHPQETSNVVTKLQNLWQETFTSWMVERTWSLTGYLPSMDEYLATGVISIAAHTIALPATDFLSQSYTNSTIKSNPEYHNITKLLMALTRLVNDTQSYQKEQADGKVNLVLLHLKENPNCTIKDSVAYVKQILEVKRKEFLEHVFMDGDMHKSCKQIHLSCMKVFQMFFNSENLFDRETALIDDIRKAIYIPIVHKSKLEPFLEPAPSIQVKNEKKKEIVKLYTTIRPTLKYPGITSYMKPRFMINNQPSARREKMKVPMKFSLCFT